VPRFNYRIGIIGLGIFVVIVVSGGLDYPGAAPGQAEIIVIRGIRREAKALV
jgi:hypothetical protein